MRALLLELRPQALEVDGIVMTLERRSEVPDQRHRINVELADVSEPDVPIGPIGPTHALYRIPQEALNSIVKYAQATQVHVRLSRNADGVMLKSTAEGHGFATDEHVPGHFGLDSTHEQTAQIGGPFDVRSESGAATTIQVTLRRPAIGESKGDDER